ncbi:hypothetical protein DSO57_1013727 [Entomophthora muscae]|uniref:Uncharacterized protein n=1 Tax=Entomophthora muscae TaxID=34485 RepID=A0ACC2URF4_9FUNG|nr:hypothetical protein DSO57_1013727 [Entomophthora muscae]
MQAMLQLPDFVIEEIFSFLSNRNRLVSKACNRWKLPSTCASLRYIEGVSCIDDFDKFILEHGSLVKSLSIRRIRHSNSCDFVLDTSMDVGLEPYLQGWMDVLKNVKHISLENIPKPELSLFHNLIARVLFLDIKYACKFYTHQEGMIRTTQEKDKSCNFLEVADFNEMLSFKKLKWIRYMRTQGSEILAFSLDAGNQKLVEVSFVKRYYVFYRFVLDRESYFQIFESFNNPQSQDPCSLQVQLSNVLNFCSKSLNAGSGFKEFKVSLFEMNKSRFNYRHQENLLCYVDAEVIRMTADSISFPESLRSSCTCLHVTRDKGTSDIALADINHHFPQLKRLYIWFPCQ